MLCFSLCLTVCGVAVSAANNEYTDGFIYTSGAPIYFGYDSTKVNFFEGYFPASFSGGSDEKDQITDTVRNFRILGEPVSFPADTQCTILNSTPMYIEVLFSCPESLTLTLSNDDNDYCSVNGILYFSRTHDGSSPVSVNANPYNFKFLCDDTDVDCDDGQLSCGSYEVQHYFGFRYLFNRFSYQFTDESAGEITMILGSFFTGTMSFDLPVSDDDLLGSIYDSIVVNTGVLQEINGKLTAIQTSTTQISNDVSDMKGQLENESSFIWSAFGNKVSSTLESLFVPSQQDIEDVKTGFDELAKDKLGGAYTAMETVEDTVSDISMKLNNPSASEGIEFPGISVPLGGDVGTVTLAEAQTVTLPTEMTAILHPVAGTIISLVCGLGTFNVLKDMVECFLSGFSYAGYLHRNKGRSDE